jgi:hypothetical protein
MQENFACVRTARHATTQLVREQSEPRFTRSRECAREHEISIQEP